MVAIITLIVIVSFLILPALMGQHKPIEETTILDEPHETEYWDKIKLVP